MPARKGGGMVGSLIQTYSNLEGRETLLGFSENLTNSNWWGGRAFTNLFKMWWHQAEKSGQARLGEPSSSKFSARMH